MNKIHYIKNININRKKWDDCISKSVNSRIYGMSWYLDIVSKNWDGIIFNDYEIVFPVIFKKILFLKKSYHPLFCQQLGFFYKNEKNITEDLIKLFHYKILREHFKNYTYQSTSEFFTLSRKIFSKNKNNNLSIFKRNNFQLDLNRSHDEIIKGYSNNTIRNLKKSKNFNFKIISNLDIDLFMKLFKKNKKIKKSIGRIFFFKKNNYSIIRNIITECLNKKKGELIGVCNEEGDTVSAAFFLTSFNHKIMLFNISLPHSKKSHSMTYLIDSFIKINSNKKIIFDFEGSEIKGVMNFYSGFGGKNNPYFLVNSN